jgi:small subunit ribosomal protein S20
MPIIKSAIKRVRQQAKRRSRNLQVKRAVHQDVRAFVDAVEAKDTPAVAETLRAAISEIDRAVKKGTIHRNTAGRRKSSLQKQANAIIGSGAEATKKSAANAPAKTTAKKAAPKKAAPKKSASK